MVIEIPDDIVMRSEGSELDFRIALAIQLYADNRIDHTDACRLAGLNAELFNQELFLRDLCVQQYPVGT